MTLVTKRKFLLGFLPRLLGGLPVLSTRGVLKGCWWSVYPQSSYWRGTFEPEITSALLQKLPGPGGCCWDFGAHFGYYSAVMARRVGKAGQVVSLEPNPASYRRLKRHCKWNRFHQVFAFPLAASDKKDTSELISCSHSLDTGTHLAYPQETRSNSATYTSIQTVRMEDFALEHQLRLPDFIKIDVEGHGAEALRGCGSILRKKRPCLIVSVHTPQEYEGFLSQFTEADYSLLPVNGTSLEGFPWPGDYLAVPH